MTERPHAERISIMVREEQGRLFVRWWTSWDLAWPFENRPLHDALRRSFRKAFPTSGDAVYVRRAKAWSLPLCQAERLKVWVAGHVRWVCWRDERGGVQDGRV